MKIWLSTLAWKLSVLLGINRLQPIPIPTEEQQRRLAAQQRRR
ncbi:hypothetical protein ACVW0Y_001077 [Pseudomonas sp. TE3786]